MFCVASNVAKTCISLTTLAAFSAVDVTFQESETPRTAGQQPAPNRQPLLLDGLGTATHQQTHSSSSRILALWSTASSTQSILKAPLQSPFTSQYRPQSRISLTLYFTNKYLH